MALALTCKALHRDYEEHTADWHGWQQGMHLRLAPTSREGLAACQKRVQKLLKLPQPLVTRLTVEAGAAKFAHDELLAMAGSLRLGVLALVVAVGGSPSGPSFEFPQARSAELSGSWRGNDALTSRLTFTSALQSLELGNMRLPQLPPSLTCLCLLNVNVAGQAADAILACEIMHSAPALRQLRKSRQRRPCACGDLSGSCVPLRCSHQPALTGNGGRAHGEWF